MVELGGKLGRRLVWHKGEVSPLGYQSFAAVIDGPGPGEPLVLVALANVDSSGMDLTTEVLDALEGRPAPALKRWTLERTMNTLRFLLWLALTDVTFPGIGQASGVETISSGLTPFYKFGFLTVWSIIWGVAAAATVFRGQPQGWAMAGVLVVGGAFIWRLLGGLKRVRLDGRNLLISNYKEEIVVPVGELAAVRQRVFISPKMVTLELGRDTPFGRWIVFMPRTLFRLFSVVEFVDRLRSLSRSAR